MQCKGDTKVSLEEEPFLDRRIKGNFLNLNLIPQHWTQIIYYYYQLQDF